MRSVALTRDDGLQNLGAVFGRFREARPTENVGVRILKGMPTRLVFGAGFAAR